MPKPKVYIAAPLFNVGERTLNASLAGVLRQAVDVYLPQTDGILFDEEIRHGGDPDEASRRIFRDDIGALRACSALLIVLNGRTVDEGAAFELGVAWALGKECVAYKDDPRQLLSVGDNPMIVQAVSRTLVDLGDVRRWADGLGRC
ncbi:nucleoside 2-deoxyribosyltransferase [Methylobacterium sp. B1]|uniref:nucleoside 2-deoxyribosyltransferase n=1 Tax=Methylobacterium sp. B1 TaxID=91459 RepID=UPI0005B7798C|nr:nucleoside 2-deoxyribosyltransferase [Methylobacterium sp. B1]